jgi:hypothetical protein
VDLVVPSAKGLLSRWKTAHPAIPLQHERAREAQHGTGDWEDAAHALQPIIGYRCFPGAQRCGRGGAAAEFASMVPMWGLPSEECELRSTLALADLCAAQFASVRSQHPNYQYRLRTLLMSCAG